MTEAGGHELLARSKAVPVMLVASRYLQACQHARIWPRHGAVLSKQTGGMAAPVPSKQGKVVATQSVRHSVQRQAQRARGLTELSASGKRLGCPSWRAASLHRGKVAPHGGQALHGSCTGANKPGGSSDK